VSTSVYIGLGRKVANLFTTTSFFAAPGSAFEQCEVGLLVARVHGCGRVLGTQHVQSAVKMLLVVATAKRMR
jgi:hypothetical protein